MRALTYKGLESKRELPMSMSISMMMRTMVIGNAYKEVQGVERERDK